jgi:arylsulfatase A-like enzyme
MRSADSRPLFLYLHLMQPHAPYGALRPRADLSEDNLTEVGNAYRSEVRLADKCVGAVLDAIGSRKDVLTIVTADHGEALGRLHHTFGHDHVFYDEVVRIPLLMSGPGLEPARVQDLARQVDLAPTIAALCGLGAAEVRRGTALSAVDPPKGAALIQFPLRGDRDAIAVTDGRTKWIVRGAAEPLLHFDLALDPTEQTPTGTLPEGAPKWQDLVGRLERGGIHHAPAGREAPNDERQARLDALGYAGD